MDGRWRTIRRGRWRTNGKPELSTNFSLEQNILKRKETYILLNTLLRQTPITEIYLAYQLTDTIYDNWGEIKRCYDVYEAKGFEGLLDDKHFQHTLSSIQNEILCRAINTYVPSDNQVEFKALFVPLFDKITGKEIEYVKGKL